MGYIQKLLKPFLVSAVLGILAIVIISATVHEVMSAVIGSEQDNRV